MKDFTRFLAINALILSAGSIVLAQEPAPVDPATDPAPVPEQQPEQQPPSAPAPAPEQQAPTAPQAPESVTIVNRPYPVVPPQAAPAPALPEPPRAATEAPKKSQWKGGASPIARTSGFVQIHSANEGGKRDGDEYLKLNTGSQGSDANRFGIMGWAKTPGDHFLPNVVFRMRLEGGFTYAGTGIRAIANDGSRSECGVSGAPGATCATAQGFNWNRFQQVEVAWGGTHPEKLPIFRLVSSGHQLSPIAHVYEDHGDYGDYGDYGLGGFKYGNNLFLSWMGPAALWVESVLVLYVNLAAIPLSSDPSSEDAEKSWLGAGNTLSFAPFLAPRKGERGQVIGFHAKGGMDDGFLGVKARFGFQETQALDADLQSFNGILTGRVGSFGLLLTATRTNRDFLDTQRPDDHAVHAAAALRFELGEKAKYGAFDTAIQSLQVAGSPNDVAQWTFGYDIPLIPGVKVSVQATVWENADPVADPAQDPKFRPDQVPADSPLDGFGTRVDLSVDAAQFYEEYLKNML